MTAELGSPPAKKVPDAAPLRGARPRRRSAPRRCARGGGAACAARGDARGARGGAEQLRAQHAAAVAERETERAEALQAILEAAEAALLAQTKAAEADLAADQEALRKKKEAAAAELAARAEAAMAAAWRPAPVEASAVRAASKPRMGAAPAAAQQLSAQTPAPGAEHPIRTLRGSARGGLAREDAAAAAVRGKPCHLHGAAVFCVNRLFFVVSCFIYFLLIFYIGLARAEGLTRSARTTGRALVSSTARADRVRRRVSYMRVVLCIVYPGHHAH